MSWGALDDDFPSSGQISDQIPAQHETTLISAGFMHAHIPDSSDSIQAKSLESAQAMALQLADGQDDGTQCEGTWCLEVRLGHKIRFTMPRTMTYFPVRSPTIYRLITSKIDKNCLLPQQTVV